MSQRSGDNPAVERWEVQARKGVLELVVLAALWSGRLYGLELIRRLEDEAQIRKGYLELCIMLLIRERGRIYGFDLLERLEAAGLPVKEGTLYPLLNRLRAEGQVDAEWVEADAGHPRKYYRLTADGRRRVVQMTRFWRGFATGIDAVLRPVPAERRK